MDRESAERRRAALRGALKLALDVLLALLSIASLLYAMHMEWEEVAMGIVTG